MLAQAQFRPHPKAHNHGAGETPPQHLTWGYMKSYALTPVRYTGRPPEDGKPHITPAISAIFTKERGYVADVPVEEAARAVRNWPQIYEYLKPEDADAESVIEKLTAKIQDLENQLAQAQRSNKGRRPKKVKHDDAGTG